MKLYNTNTNERVTIVFRRSGEYVPAGLDELNSFFRDWRREEETEMDPALLDLVWNVYRETGSDGFIHVNCAYRSPETNEKLRKRSKGVAEDSQHIRGKAIDFFIPGVPLWKLRAIALRHQEGGVGYYPTSRLPFVHLDTGSVRHWPRMSRQELAAIFPEGGTVHVPLDGKPLRGYEEAVATQKLRDSFKDLALAASDSRRRKLNEESGSMNAEARNQRQDEEGSNLSASNAHPPLPRFSPIAPGPNGNKMTKTGVAALQE